MRVAEFVGGPLDGRACQLAARFGAVTAVMPDGAPAGFYAREDDTGEFTYCGTGYEGVIVMGIIGEFRDDARSERELIEEARKPRGCNSCGLIFGSQGAHQIHRDGRWPGGCLPPGALGQLEDVDGVWCQPGATGR